MPRFRTIVALILTIWMAAGQARGQLAPLAKPDNAALFYYRAWLIGPADELKKVEEAIGTDRTDLEKDAEVGKSLETLSEHIGILIRAGDIQGCTWGVEWEQGFGALLPHLGKMRSSARVLGLDALRMANEGKSHEAALRLAALFRLSHHACSDGVLINSLVGIAINSLACAKTETILERKQLTAEDAALVLAAARSLSAADPFRVKDAINAEGWIISTWFPGEYAKRGAPFLKEAMGTVNEDAAIKEAWKTVEKMDAAAVMAACKKTVGYYQAVIDAWDKPDAEAKVNELEKKMKSGEYGQIGQLLAPAFNRVYTGNAKGIAAWKGCIEKLEGAAKNAGVEPGK